MEYNFREIEKKWQKRWVEEKTYQVTEDDSKQKFYVLNMFPYPSGAGLHVGHPLGYIASDIYARYKRLQGFNVLNPMGYDAYGLPAEQYAIQTGQHPAITTVNNINRYREQLDKIGFSSTGTVKSVLATRNIIIGPNGPSKKCSTAIIVTMNRKPVLSKNWKKPSPSTETKDSMPLAAKISALLPKSGTPKAKKKSKKS